MKEILSMKIAANITYINKKPVIEFGDRIIPIEIQYDTRKNLQISIHREPKIVIKSPKGIPEAKIIQALFSRLKWIIKRLQHREEIQPFPSKFTYFDGEKHLYLGQEYELRIQHGKRVRVWFSNPYIEIEVPDPGNTYLVKEALEYWYGDETAEYVSQRTWYFIKQFVPEQLHPKLEFKFRKMKSRWGSCSSKGLITFNKELIRAPREAIDYIIVHELCHLKHFDHSSLFYQELSKIIPDWKTYRKMLERISLG